MPYLVGDIFPESLWCFFSCVLFYSLFIFLFPAPPNVGELPQTKTVSRPKTDRMSHFSQGWKSVLTKKRWGEKKTSWIVLATAVFRSQTVPSRGGAWALFPIVVAPLWRTGGVQTPNFSKIYIFSSLFLFLKKQNIAIYFWPISSQ